MGVTLFQLLLVLLFSSFSSSFSGTFSFLFVTPFYVHICFPYLSHSLLVPLCYPALFSPHNFISLSLFKLSTPLHLLCLSPLSYLPPCLSYSLSVLILRVSCSCPFLPLCIHLPVQPIPSCSCCWNTWSVWCLATSAV